MQPIPHIPTVDTERRKWPLPAQPSGLATKMEQFKVLPAPRNMWPRRFGVQDLYAPVMAYKRHVNWSRQ